MENSSSSNKPAYESFEPEENLNNNSYNAVPQNKEQYNSYPESQQKSQTNFWLYTNDYDKKI